MEGERLFGHLPVIYVPGSEVAPREVLTVVMYLSSVAAQTHLAQGHYNTKEVTLPATMF